MKAMKSISTLRIVTLAALFFGCAALLRAQASQPDEPAKPKANKQTDTATKNAEDQPKWDPLRAEKDLEVGQYYMRIGKIDAAMDRFQDAIEAKPGYAVPFLYLAEAQEKKGMRRVGVGCDDKYLVP